jgi:hypothetical protein
LEVTDTCLYLDLNEEYRYFRLVLDDSSVTKIRIGYIVISEEPYLQMPSISPESEIYYSTTSDNSLSIGGQVFSSEGYNYMQTKFMFPQIGESSTTILGETIANRLEILEMWRYVQNITPIWVMLWANNLDEHPPLFCIIDQNQLFFKKLNYGKYYSTDITLREVK